MSERVTWETCPRCGHAAAVGWEDERPVGIDCPGGCPISAADFLREAPRARGATSLARWSTAVHRWS